MALALHEQAIGTITRANHLLICFPEQLRGDGVASALGLARAIEALRPGHQVDVVSSGFHESHRQRFAFLPGADRVVATLSELHGLTIRVPCADAAACDVRHRVHDGHLEIQLTPHAGTMSAEHIEASLSQYKYDCIVVVDAPDLASLGSLYANHAEFFQSTPTVTFDHAPDHERYGHVNVIDIAAAACGEVCAAFLETAAAHTIDADVATCLLTGILAKTRSFRSPRMTPRTFAIVSMLLERGARREEVVQRLFQTKSIGQLQLWGRALTRLRTDRDRQLVWTILSQHDFLAAGAQEAELPDIVDELLVNSPEAACILLITQATDQSLRVSAACPTGRYDASELLRPLGGTGSATHAAATLTPQPLIEAERAILDTVRGRMRS